jgi:hypothetical protein
MLLEEDFKCLSFEKVSVAWRKFLNDFTNLLNEKSSSLSFRPDDLNLDLGGDSDG